MSFSRKAINFDLSTEELKKYFQNTAYVYNSIKKFMLENGFEHRQYSGYASIQPVEDFDIAVLARKLNEKFIWLKDCVQEFDVTDIGEQHSLTHIFKIDKNIIKEPAKENVKEHKKKELDMKL